MKIRNEPKPIFTGEKNLTLTKEQIIDKVRKNICGAGYLDVMEKEAPILVRMGLFKGWLDENRRCTMFYVPDWDKFIYSVHAFYVTSYSPESYLRQELRDKEDI